jgi:phosphate-selective porin OprO/OprP
MRRPSLLFALLALALPSAARADDSPPGGQPAVVPASALVDGAPHDPPSLPPSPARSGRAERRSESSLDLLGLHPAVRLDMDLRFLRPEPQGEDGFVVRRLWLGAWAAPTPWLFALASFNVVSGEKAPIVDAYVTVTPHSDLRISAGFQRTPLFATARSELEWTLPIPELSMPTRAFWPGRDAGVEAHWLLSWLPVEAWARVGNGTASASGNDSQSFAFDGRLDAVLGRARVGAVRSELLGLRVGGGVHAHNNFDRPGVTGSTADGFVFYRAPVVSGGRSVVEGHLLSYLGPVKLTGEIGYSLENRAVNKTGRPDDPRVFLDAVHDLGGSVELAWMITGQHRLTGSTAITYAPTEGFDLRETGLEIAARYERLTLGSGARDVKEGGATGLNAALTWWLTSYVSWSFAYYRYTYDTPPLETPQDAHSWLALSRLTFALGWPGLSATRDLRAPLGAEPRSSEVR